MPLHSRSRWILGPCLIAGIALSVFKEANPDADDMLVTASEPTNATDPAISQKKQPGARADLVIRKVWNPPSKDPFQFPQEAEPPLFVALVEEPSSQPSKPTVPPLPFQYLGALEDSSGNWIVQLKSTTSYIAVEKGELIDGLYRLEGYQDSALIFTYVPTGDTLTLQTELER